MGDIIPCSICGKPATVHWTQIIDGKATNVHLCQNCAKKSKNINSLIEPIAHALSLIKAQMESETEEETPAPSTPSAPAKQCPNCGLTSAELEKTNRPGCAHCYKVFEDELAKLIAHTQPGWRHEGKHPSGNALKSALRDALSKARQRMDAAIKTENYEDAAKLRDEIRKLEATLETAAAEPATA
jgi:protein arginine kinase activator